MLIVVVIDVIGDVELVGAVVAPALQTKPAQVISIEILMSLNVYTEIYVGKGGTPIVVSTDVFIASVLVIGRA